ncbi:MAG: hypothetical protein Kow0063_13220 [Anaerolineae bacterium]
MSTELSGGATSSAEGSARWSHLRHGLGKTLLAWFLLLPVMSLIIAGIIIGIITVRNARQAAVERLSAISTLKQAEVSAWVASQQEQLDLIANTPDIRSKILYIFDNARASDASVVTTRDQLQDYVSVVTSRSGWFEDLFLLNTSGRVVFSSDPSLVGTSHGLEAYFLRGKEAPYVHPPFYSLYTAAPSMLVTQPVRDNEGRVSGVLVARLNLDQMADVMTEESGLGQTGETYLVNAAGLLLTPLRFGGELVPGQELRTEGVYRALALASPRSQEKAGWAVYPNYQGRPVVGVYRWLPDLQIVLLAEQEMSEILLSTRDILVTSLLILLVMAGVAVGIAVLVSGRITRPLVGLTTSANLIASGDLSHQVPYTERRDEIGTLARAFNQMSHQLRDLITGLEEQVNRRTRQWQEANYKLQRRAIQLEAVTLVGRAIISILNLDDLLLEIVNLICARFGFYHAGIFLIDESGEWAVLRQASGEAGQRMLARKHRLAVGGQSIVGWVTAHRQPRIALDVGEDAVHFKNPDLPHTRSEMALPLMVGRRLLGVLDVQSVEEAAFDDEDVTILSLMADQVAVAIDNALKFSQEAAILEATSPIYRASRHIAMATSLNEVLRSIVDHATGPYVDYCAISTYTAAEEEGAWGSFEVAAVWDRAGDLLYSSGDRFPPEDPGLANHLQQRATDPLVIHDLLIEPMDERIGSTAHHAMTEELRLRAVLILPLLAAGQIVGLLIVASRQPHIWTEAELRTFRSLSDQTAIAVENIHLLKETQVQAGRERIIRQITERMWRTIDVESILQTTVESLGQAIGAPRVYARLSTDVIGLETGNGNGAHPPGSGERQSGSGQGAPPPGELL